MEEDRDFAESGRERLAGEDGVLGVGGLDDATSRGVVGVFGVFGVAGAFGVAAFGVAALGVNALREVRAIGAAAAEDCCSSSSASSSVGVSVVSCSGVGVFGCVCLCDLLTLLLFGLDADGES